MKLLLIDEDFPHQVGKILQEYGHDVISLNDLELAGIGLTDEDVLATATNLERAVLTHNRKDFLRLHKKSKEHAGIIVCTRNPDLSRLGEKIHSSIDELDALHGLCIKIYRD